MKNEMWKGAGQKLNGGSISHVNVK